MSNINHVAGFDGTILELIMITLTDMKFVHTKNNQYYE